jgi:DNA helicase II / ATP-dependent DNA helicase PcrA
MQELFEKKAQPCYDFYGPRKALLISTSRYSNHMTQSPPTFNDTIHAFNEFLSSKLNNIQQETVRKKEGIILIRAGAGSGKTRVITTRMANLILNEGVRPDSIVALTFTNKAAREMKERMSTFLKDSTDLPSVGTFHSYCLRLLKSNSHFTGFQNFSVLDTNDQDKLIRTIITKYSLQKRVSPKNILHTISRLKNDSTQGTVNIDLIPDPLVKQVYQAYEHEKMASHCLDFDDLLLETLSLFRKNSLFRSLFQEQIRHIVVDEYQDTNKVQHALLKVMAQDEHGLFTLDSLCVVGDEDQSIYSWRGATASNIIHFSQDFTQTHSVTIEQNYRSVQPILKIANKLISHNTQRNPKQLWSVRQGEDRIRILTCSSGQQESELIALLVHILVPQTTAILYRSHHQSRSIEEALICHAIPYKIIGGIQFYERLEIKDTLAYLRLIVNPFDRVSLLRVINTPHRGLGEKFQELFMAEWDANPFLDFKQLTHKLIQDAGLSTTRLEALNSFLQIFDNLSSTDKAEYILDTIIKRTNYLSYLREAFEKEEALAKVDNVNELLYAITTQSAQNHSLQTFLDEVTLMQEHASAIDEKNCVLLMTLHAAKGLEFDTVIIIGLEEGLLPSSHALYDTELIEEERRLLYVGITRARERLIITHSHYRYTYGSITDQRISRFLQELGPLHHEDVSSWNSTHARSYYTQWLTCKIIEPPSHKRKSPLPQIKSDTTLSPEQLVKHPDFGIGSIISLDYKADNKIYAKIKFPTGVKKISIEFLTPLS